MFMQDSDLFFPISTGAGQTKMVLSSSRVGLGKEEEGIS